MHLTWFIQAQSEREGFKKIIKKLILITFGSEPPLPKVIISFSATGPIFENFWKKCIFPLKKSKTQKNFQKREKMSLGQADVGCTMQNVNHIMQNVSHNMLNVCQGPKGGLDFLGDKARSCKGAKLCLSPYFFGWLEK